MSTPNEVTSTTPNHLKSEVQSILTEIPYTFVALANVDSSDTSAIAARAQFIALVRAVHRSVGDAFDEPRAYNIGVIGMCDDLTRWSSIWVWHPYAEYWVKHLRHALRVGTERKI